jgi:hypothetical protein
MQSRADSRACNREARRWRGRRTTEALLAKTSRDLRYWTSRRATCPDLGGRKTQRCISRSTVTILREDGRRQTCRIVGEDRPPFSGTR